MVGSRYAFQGFTLDLAARTLAHRGVAVSLRPKTMATLVYLVTHRDRVATKDDLLDAVWRGAEVQDQAVFQSISELRAVFGRLRCIETVRGRGYRWIQPMDVAGHGRGGHWQRWSVASLAAAACLAVGSWPLLNPRDAALTFIVHPVETAGMTVPGSQVASSIDRMLVEQLRRRGWEATPADDAADPATVQVRVDRRSVADGLMLRFEVLATGSLTTGRVRSQTPLGAVRDLAAELHDVLASAQGSVHSPLSTAHLLKRATARIDAGDFVVAEAYLTVLAQESPEHLGAKLALAYTLDQTGRGKQALALARAVYELAGKPNAITDKMRSAMMLSRLMHADGDLHRAEQLAHEAMGMAARLEDLVILAEAQEQLGEISLARGELASAREQFAVALQYFSAFCPTGEKRVAARLLALGQG